MDWDDACAVISDPGNPVVTAGDAIAEAHSWDRSAWHWLAESRYTFASIYLRGRSPELVREFAPAKGT